MVSNDPLAVNQQDAIECGNPKHMQSAMNLA